MIDWQRKVDYLLQSQSKYQMFSPAQHPAQQQVITILLKRNNVPKTRFPNNVEWVDPLFPENIICQKGKNCSSKIISRTHFSNSMNCTMKKLFLLTYLSKLHAFCTPTHFQKKLTAFYFSVWTCSLYLDVFPVFGGVSPWMCFDKCVAKLHIYRKQIKRVWRCYI